MFDHNLSYVERNGTVKGEIADVVVREEGGSLASKLEVAEEFNFNASGSPAEDL